MLVKHVGKSEDKFLTESSNMNCLIRQSAHKVHFSMVKSYV